MRRSPYLGATVLPARESTGGSRAAVTAKALRAFPVAEESEKVVSGRRREVVLGQAAQGMDRLPHLIEVGLAAATGGDVCLEASPLLQRERALEIVGDELHELLAGEAVG